MPAGSLGVVEYERPALGARVVSAQQPRLLAPMVEAGALELVPDSDGVAAGFGIEVLGPPGALPS
jgi:hypothetical protein